MSGYDVASDAGGRTYAPKKKRRPPAQPPAGAKGPAKAPPQQKPAGAQGPVKAEPQQHGLTPLKPPVPILQTYGFHGSIDDFVQRLHEGVDAFHNSFGYKPSPALAFDLARYPGPHPFESLFNHPATQQEADAVNAQQSNEPPILPMLRNAAPAGMLGPASSQEELHKQYPSVPVGTLPIEKAGSVDAFFQLAQELGGKGQLPVRSQGQTIEEYAAMLKAAGQTKGGESGGYSFGQRVSSTDEATGKKLVALSNAVLGLKDAQKQLNEEMGTKLPVTGVFNNDWLNAVSNWMQSKDYFTKVVQKQAADAGYANPQKYLAAWKNKQQAVEKSGWTQHLFNALPIQAFDHGFNPFGMLRSEAEYLTFGYKAINPTSLGFYSPTVRLHELTRSGGLVLNVVGGTVAQGKADLQAGSAFMQAITPKGAPVPGLNPAVRGKGETLEEAKASARKALAEHPSWVRVAAPGLAAGSYDTTIAKVADLAGDLILLRKPQFTGERVAAGSVEKARGSAYVNSAAHYAYQDLLRGDTGRAAARLEGGHGAERLVARAKPLVENGNMSEEQFRNHLAELYAHGQTTMVRTGGKPVLIEGPALASLRASTLPTPKLAGKGWDKFRMGLRKTADNLDEQLRGSVVGDKAANLISGIRSEFSHNIAPGGHALSNPKLPERVHDFVLSQTGDAKLANRFEARLVEARAKENYTAIQKIQDELTKQYNLKFPLRESGRAGETFTPVLDTEGPSVFQFPKGGMREIDSGLAAVEQSARSMNKFLVRVAQGHARIILGFPLTGFSLFYKHMLADTSRRFVAEDGRVVGYTPDMKRAKAEINALANSDPKYSHLLGTAMARSRESETRWMLNRGHVADNISFSTGEKLGKGNYMEAAGGYLRRRLDSEGIQAYQQASAGGGMQPLVDLILKNKQFRHMWKSARKKEPITAEEYAQVVFKSYRDVEDGLMAQGLTFQDAAKVMQANRGSKVDKALGHFVTDNNIDFPVSSGQVARYGGLDSLSGAWIEKLMTFNKWNRGQLFERTLHKTYGQLTAAGMEKGPALEVSADLAERMVTHHMLDFANRLKIEQDLRWLSYFATKHRLYWKWVVGTLARNPRYAAFVYDSKQYLDQGNINLPMKVLGQDLAVPVSRLFWVPGREYSEVSPLALGVFGLATGGLTGAVNEAKGNFGNIVTRNDTSAALGVKWLGMKFGKTPATYEQAVAGLDERSQAFMNYRINSFQSDYFNEHGHFAPESEAVKFAILHSMANEAWRSNLPLPVIPQGRENKGQKLLRQFEAIRDPKRRREFLDKHEDLALYFGVYKDPNQYVHLRPLWASYTAALDRRENVRQQVYEQAKKGGYTPELKKVRKKADDQFRKTFDELLAKDLAGTPQAQRKEIEGQQYGWWGQQVSVDPLADPRKTLKALFPNLKDVSGVPGETIKHLKQELKLLNDPNYVAKTYPDPNDARTRKGVILQQLDVFNSYPKDDLGRLERTYQIKYVGKYWDEYTKRADHIANDLAKNEKDVAYAQLREWKDSQDHPVTIDGVKFPSPLRMAWASMDPVRRKEALAQIASGSWDHLADYEKELLGRKVPGTVSDKWAYYEKTLADYRQQFNEQGHNLPSTYKATLAKWIDKNGGAGFYKDWLFAQKPAYERLALYAPIQQSSHHKDWVGLLSVARAYAVTNEKASATARRAIWKTYVKDSLLPELAKPENRGFAREVKLYGPDFIYTLIN